MSKMSKIVIVEDDLTTVKLLKFMLESKKYEILHYTNGSEAEKNIENEMPDLILMDVMLPEVNGIEITKKLKQSSKTAHIPIIIISALGQEIEVMNGLQAGAEAYIVKPFDSQSLSRLIEEKLS